MAASDFFDFSDVLYEPGEQFYLKMYIVLEDKKVNIKRAVYTLLDMLGDVGGLYGALQLVFASILSTFVTFGYSNSVINSNYDYIAKKFPRKNSI